MTTRCLVTGLLLCALMTGANAAVVAVANGYEVSYGINMNPGTSNGNDVTTTLISRYIGGRCG